MRVRGRFLALLLSSLLLFAQQVAFLHGLWHAKADLERHARDELAHGGAGNSAEHLPQSPFCAQHISLAQVLGAATPTAAVLEASTLEVERVPEADCRYRHVAFVFPQSRSPPVFS